MRYLITLMLIFINTFVARSQHYARHRLSDSVAHLTKEMIIADIDDYAKGVARNHVNAFTVIKRRDFFKEIQKIKDSAGQLNIDVLLIRLMKVNAMIGDEHTNIAYIARDLFPFSCYWFSEGIFVTATDERNEPMLHAKVIAVNNMPIDSVAERIALLSTDRNKAGIKYKLQRSLFDPFVIHGLEISPSRDGVIYTMIKQNGDTVLVRPISKDKREMSLHKHSDKKFLRRMNKGDDYWYQFDDTARYLYFYYGACHDQDKDHLFADLEKRMEVDIERKKPAKIIIDMRDNQGGVPVLLHNFISYLNTSSLNRKGHIYVLIGRKTFSSAIINSTQLKEATYAQLVGEETSGSVAFYAGTEWFTLPATGLKVQYSTQYWSTNEKYNGSLRPDVLIQETFADYLSGIDAALEYAISH